ncbi:hypothetical protein ACFW9V_33785 [Streptomyces hygroscopicus]|uniref:hypothetical protein n=1 Tax=Streptomyces hygroscopicus TaxID=1912 RepID=UPI00368185ED
MAASTISSSAKTTGAHAARSRPKGGCSALATSTARRASASARYASRRSRSRVACGDPAVSTWSRWSRVARTASDSRTDTWARGPPSPGSAPAASTTPQASSVSVSRVKPGSVSPPR